MRFNRLRQLRVLAPSPVTTRPVMEGPKRIAIMKLVDHAAERLLYPAASHPGLLDITVRHLQRAYR